MSVQPRWHCFVSLGVFSQFFQSLPGQHPAKTITTKDTKVHEA